MASLQNILAQLLIVAMTLSQSALPALAYTGTPLIRSARAQTLDGVVYSARLLKDGTPVTAPVTMRFGLYAASDGGVPTWQETHGAGSCPAITPDSNGNLSATLGECVGLPILDEEQDVYLEVAINGSVTRPRLLFQGAAVPVAVSTPATEETSDEDRSLIAALQEQVNDLIAQVASLRSSSGSTTTTTTVTDGSSTTIEGDTTVSGNASVAGTLDVQGDIDTATNIKVGSSIETIANPNFKVDGGDVFVADTLGVENRIYTDVGTTVGASTQYDDGLIDAHDRALNVNTVNNQPVNLGTGLTTIGGDLKVEGSLQDLDLDKLSNVGSDDASVGRILIGDGDSFESKAVSGDISLSKEGVVTVTASSLSADSVLESHLKAVDTAGDEECLTYETTVGDFEWQSCGGGSSLASLSDVNTATATAGNFLIADGTDWESVAISGDATVTGTGVLSVSDNAIDGGNIALGSDASGDLMYYNGTDWTRLPAGTAGQLLQTNGAAAPTWVTGSSNTSDGTVTGQTLYWTGSNWAPSAVLTNDTSTIATSGDLDVSGAATVSGNISGAAITGTGSLSVETGATVSSLISCDTVTTDASGVLTCSNAKPITDGTTTYNTLVWNGTNWVESSVLTNDGSTVATTGGLDVSGGVQVDTTTLVVDVINDRLGVGTASPEGNFHVSDAGPSQVILERVDTSVLPGNDIGSLQFFGGEDSTEERVAEIRAEASSAWTTTASPTQLVFVTTPSGSLTPVDRAMFTAGGHFVPFTTDTYNLGADSLRWQDLYLGAETLHIGTSTTDEGTIEYDTTNNVLVFNEGGLSTDHRFEGDNEANLLVLDASTDRIGIGTALPDVTLTVAGSTNVTGGLTVSNGDITFNGLTTLTGDLTADSSSITFSSFASCGSLTTSADGTLVCSSAASTNQVIDTDSDSTAGFQDDDIFAVNIAGTEQLSADSTGIQIVGTLDVTGGLHVDGTTLFVDAANNRVGIGTVTPSGDLDITSGANTNVTIGSGGTDSIVNLSLQNDTRDWTLNTRGDISDGFSVRDETAGAHRLFIDENGQVGIGTTAPSRTLSVTGSGLLTGGLDISGDTRISSLLTLTGDLTTDSSALTFSAFTSCGSLTTSADGTLVCSSAASTNQVIDTDSDSTAGFQDDDIFAINIAGTEQFTVDTLASTFANVLTGTSDLSIEGNGQVYGTLDVSGDFTAGSNTLFYDTSANLLSLTLDTSGQFIELADGTDTFGLYNVPNSPESEITANTGSLAIDSSNGKLYIKTDDGDNTNWTDLGAGSLSVSATLEATTTLAANTSYTVDTSAGDFTLTLPATPANGDHIRIIDVSASFDDNGLILTRGGSTTIEGGVSSTLTAANGTYDLFYDSTQSRWDLASHESEAPVTLHRARIHNTAVQSITHGTDTTIEFNTQDHNVGMTVDLAAEKITVTQAGYYQMTGVVNITSGTNNASYFSKLAVDGTVIAQASIGQSTGSLEEAPVVTTTKYLNVGDEITLIGRHQGTSSAKNTIPNSGTSVYLEVNQLPSAVVTNVAQATEYLHAGNISGTLTGAGTGLTVGTIDSSGSSITNNGDGSFTLEGGKTYKLTAKLYGNGANELVFWTQGVNGTQVGERGAVVSANQSSSANTQDAIAYVSPGSDTTYALDTNGGSIPTDTNAGSIVIEVIADGTKVAQFTGATLDTTGASGFIPAPDAGQNGSFLLGDGGWTDSGLLFLSKPEGTLSIGTSAALAGTLEVSGTSYLTGTSEISVASGIPLTLTIDGSGQLIGFNDLTDTFGLYNTPYGPDGEFAANIGSLALDTSAGALYIKTTGSVSNTGWTQVGAGTTIDTDEDTKITFETDSNDEDIIRFDTAGTQRLTLDPHGALTLSGSFHASTIGIGIAAPNEGSTGLSLDVSGDANVAGSLSLSDTSNVLSLTIDGTGAFMTINDLNQSASFYTQQGTPENAIVANAGSLTLDTSAGKLYIKGDSGDNTGWTDLGLGAISVGGELSTTTTLVANTSYTLDTSTGDFTVTLPAAPTDGTRVRLIDVANSFDDNNLIVSRGGSDTIEGGTSLLLSAANGTYDLFYDADRSRWDVANHDSEAPVQLHYMFLGHAGTTGTTDNIVMIDKGAYRVFDLSDASWDQTDDPNSMIDTTNDYFEIKQAGRYTLQMTAENETNSGNTEIRVNGVLRASNYPGSASAPTAIMWEGQLEVGDQVTFGTEDVAITLRTPQLVVRQLPSAVITNVAQAAEYMEATFSGVQNSDISSGDHFKFDTVVNSSGSNISLDTTTAYTNGAGASLGRFTLQSGKTYKLYAYANGSGSGFALDFEWFDVTNSAGIGERNSIYEVDATGTDGGGGQIVTFFTPTVDTLVEVRIQGVASLTQLGIDGTRLPTAVIEMVADGTKVAQFTGATLDTTGASGFIPAPDAGQNGSFLLGDGGWTDSGLLFLSKPEGTLSIGTSAALAGTLEVSGTSYLTGTSEISVASGIPLTLTIDGSGQLIGFNDLTDTFGLYNTPYGPDGEFAANIGSLALDTSAGALYIKTTGSVSNTGWTQVGAGTTIDTDEDTKITFETDSNDEDIIRFDTAGTQRLTLDPHGALTLSGSFHASTIGIGIAAPNEGSTGLSLDVSGDANVAGSLSLSDTSNVLSLTIDGTGAFMTINDLNQSASFYTQQGTPENAIVANAGSLTLDTSAGKLYIKGDSGDNTGWTDLGLGAISVGGELSTTTTLVANTSYTLDTSTGDFTVTLPAAPTDGTRVRLIDVANSFDDNNLIVSRGGSDTIEGGTSLLLSAANGTYDLFYDADRSRWDVANHDSEAPVQLHRVNITIPQTADGANIQTHTVVESDPDTLAGAGAKVTFTTGDANLNVGGMLDATNNQIDIQQTGTYQVIVALSNDHSAQSRTLTQLVHNETTVLTNSEDHSGLTDGSAARALTWTGTLTAGDTLDVRYPGYAAGTSQLQNFSMSVNQLPSAMVTNVAQAAEYMYVRATADDNNNSNGDAVAFDTIDTSSGSSITFNNGADTFTLQAGKTYRLSAATPRVTDAWVLLQWHDGTTGYGSGGFYERDATSGNSSAGLATALITPTSDLTVHLRVIDQNSNGTVDFATTNGAERPWALIETIADGTSVAQFTGATASANGATGFIGAPQAGDQGSFLLGDGDWSDPNQLFLDETNGTLTIGTSAVDAGDTGLAFHVQGNANITGALDVTGDFSAGSGTLYYSNTLGTLSIGTSQAHTAAALDISSDTRGILLPRLATTERDAITGPDAGLLLYNNTDNAFNFYDGDSWEAVGTGGLTVNATLEGTTTLAANTSYTVDTSAGDFTLTLPSAPTDGAHIRLIDVSASFDDNGLIVSRGGTDTIEGGTSTTLTAQNGTYDYYYNSATGRWDQASHEVEAAITLARYAFDSQTDQNDIAAGTDITIENGTSYNGGITRSGNEFTLPQSDLPYFLDARVGFDIDGNPAGQLTIEWVDGSNTVIGTHNTAANTSDAGIGDPDAYDVVSTTAFAVIDASGGAQTVKLRATSGATNFDVISVVGMIEQRPQAVVSNVAQAAEYVFAELATDQTSDLANNTDHVKFDTVAQSSGSSILLDTVTAYTPTTGADSVGVFTLAAGKTYKLSGAVATLTSGDYMSVGWYNHDTDTLLDAQASGTAVEASATPGAGVPTEAIAVFTPTANTRVKLGIRDTNATTIRRTDLTLGGTRAFIEVLADGTKVAQFTGATLDTTGASGFVGAPNAGQNGSFLLGDSTWTDPNVLFLSKPEGTLSLGTSAAIAGTLELSGNLTGDADLSIAGSGHVAGDLSVSGDLSVGSGTLYYSNTLGTLSIGTSQAHTAAALDISSDTRGILLPRLATTERDAITGPDAGLLLYNNTDNAFNFYDGDSWEAVGTGGLTVNATLEGTTTLAANTSYTVDTSAGDFTLTLPSAPTDGAHIRLIDVSASFDDNGLIVSRGGTDTIEGGTSTTLTAQNGTYDYYYDATQDRWDVADHNGPAPVDLHRAYMSTGASSLNDSTSPLNFGDSAFSSSLEYDPNSIIDTPNDKLVIQQAGLYTVQITGAIDPDESDTNSVQIQLNGSVVAETPLDADSGGEARIPFAITYTGNLAVNDEFTFVKSNASHQWEEIQISIEQLPSAIITQQYAGGAHLFGIDGNNGVGGSIAAATFPFETTLMRVGNDVAHSNGTFTLQGGRTYKLTGTVGWQRSGSSMLRYRWHNSSGTQIGVEAASTNDAGSGIGEGNGTVAIAYINVPPGTTDTVTLNYDSNSTTIDDIIADRTWASIEVVASDIVTTFTGATASASGTAGFIGAPNAGQQGSFLLGDATWSDANTLFLGKPEGTLSIGTSAAIAGTLEVTGQTLFGADVGIGTTTPGIVLNDDLTTQLTLHVSSDSAATRIISSGTVGVLDLIDNDATANQKWFELASTNGDLRLGMNNDDGTTAIANVLVADGATGNVGIGTASPSATLSVDGTANVSGYYRFTANAAVPTDGNAYIFDQSGVGPTISGANIDLRTGSTPSSSMYIASNGQVGIGTTSPGYELDVSQSEVGGEVVARVRNEDNSNTASNAFLRVEAGGTSGGDAGVQIVSNGTSDWSVGVDNSDSDKFKISRSTAIGTLPVLTIDGSENVGIGTASPSATLHISSSGAIPTLVTDQDQGIVVTNSASGENARLVLIGANNANSIIDFGDSDDSDLGYVQYDHTNDRMSFGTANAERVRWDATETVFNESGNSTDFRVEGDGISNLLLVDASADSVGFGTSTPSAVVDVVATAGNNAMEVTASGDAGLGAAASFEHSPSVDSGTEATVDIQMVQPAHTTTGNTNIALHLDIDGTGFPSASNNLEGIRIDPSTMSVDSDRTVVGINIANTGHSGDTAYGLRISGSNWDRQIYTDGEIYFDSLPTNASTEDALCIDDDDSGRVYQNSDSDCPTSSIKYKQDIEEWHEGGLDQVLQLQPKTFRYNNGSQRDDLNRPFLGFIAEDVRDVFEISANYENKLASENDVNDFDVRSVVALYANAFKDVDQKINENVMSTDALFDAIGLGLSEEQTLQVVSNADALAGFSAEASRLTQVAAELDLTMDELVQNADTVQQFLANSNIPELVDEGKAEMAMFNERLASLEAQVSPLTESGEGDAETSSSSSLVLQDTTRSGSLSGEGATTDNGQVAGVSDEAEIVTPLDAVEFETDASDDDEVTEEVVEEDEKGLLARITEAIGQVFSKAATFLAKVTFRDHVAVGGDTAGVVTIPSGAQEATVTFAKAYDTTPVVTVTVVGAGPGAYVQNVTAAEFTVQLSAPAARNTQINWIAVGQEGSTASVEVGTVPAATNEAETLRVEAVEDGVAPEDGTQEDKVTDDENADAAGDEQQVEEGDEALESVEVEVAEDNLEAVTEGSLENSAS